MKIPEFRRKDPGDYKAFTDWIGEVSDALGISPPEIEPLFEGENKQLERLSSLAQRHMNFADQHNSKVQKVILTNDVEKTIASGVKGQVEHIIVTQAFGVDTKKDALEGIENFGWTNGSEPGTIRIVAKLQKDTIGLVKLLIFGE